MTTPNIVPKLDGEGALGRDGRAWASVQARLISSPVFKLLVPTADQLTAAQADTSSLYLSGGSLFNGTVEIAKKSQVDTLQATVNAFFGDDRDDGLNSIFDRFDSNKDTLLEILDAIDTFATIASVDALGVQINTLDATVTSLGSQLNTLNATVTSIGSTQNTHGTRLDAIEAYTTDNVGEGGSNQYYTDARADARVDAGFAAKSTDDLSEGTSNLYHTTARARTAISATDSGGDGALSYDSSTGVLAYTGPSAAEVRAHFVAGSNISITNGTISSAGTLTAALIGNVTGDVTGTVSDISNHDTDALSEGSTNQYFTDARSRGAVSVTDAGGDGSLAYNNSTGVLTYTGPSAAEVRAHFSGGSNITVTGGTIATASTITAALTGNVTGNLTGDVTGTVSSIANHDTDALSEGSSNLYFTDGRARASVSVTDAGGDGSLAYNNSTGVITYTGPSAAEVRAHISAGGDLTYNSSTGELSFTQRTDAQVNTLADARIAASDTDDISEGSTNLYFTNTRADARADARISASPINTLSNVNASPSNGQVLQYDGTNWVAGSLSGSGLVDSVNGATGVVTLDTDDIAEGSSNLYFTDSRADTRADARIQATRLDQLLPATSNISLGNKSITDLGTPTNSTDAANKSYVDSVAQGLYVHQAVRVATTSALSAFGWSSGTFTESSATGALSVDGVTLVNGDRVLVKDESSKAQNGIYLVANIDGSSAVTLTRATDFDEPNEIAGAFFFVQEGNTSVDKAFVCTTNTAGFTINSTALVFEQFSSATDLSFSSPLQRSGNTISLPTLSIADGGTGATTAAAARTALDVDQKGTDNSTNVTLATVTGNYLTLSGQEITAGTVPLALGGTGATSAAAARTALGVDAAGTDNSTNVTLANTNYLSISGQEITGGTVPISSGGTGATSAAGARAALDVDQKGTDNSTDVTLATVSGNYLSISGQVITAGTVPLSLGGTGATSAASARAALDVDQKGTDNSTNVTLANTNYLSISGQEITGGTVPIASGGTGATTAAAARTALGVDASGTDNSTNVTLATVSNNYLSLSGQEITAGTVPIALGGTGKTSASGARSNLGLEIGFDVQAYDAQLADIAGLAVTDGGFIVGDGSNFVLETGATARTSLGLGTAATADTGTSANNVVVLDGSAKLPAVDGSNLTGLPSSDLVNDTTPQLGGDLDVNAKAIITASGNADIALTPHGTGKVAIAGDGSTSQGGVSISSGLVDVKNAGTASEVRLYCESSNAHYVALQSPAHSAFSGNITFKLPATDGSNGQVLKTDGSANLGWVSQSSGPADTDALSEGTTNLYYTDARADARIAAASLTDLVDVDFTAGAGIDNYVLTYDHSGQKWGAEAAGGARPLLQTVTGSSITIGGTNDTNGAISASELERIFKFTSTSDVTVTLPNASVGAGFKVQLKSATSKTVKINTVSSQTIDGTDYSSSTLDISTQYNSYTLVSDGSNWNII